MSFAPSPQTASTSQKDEHDRARYTRLLALAAEVLSLADTRSPGEILRIFLGDMSIRTPFVGVDAAIFDDRGRMLLIRRGDNGRWAMPGGASEVGELPSRTAERETLEETGIQTRAVRLAGVYDSRLVGSPDAVHLYHLVFICERVGGEFTPTGEAAECGYFTEAEAADLPLHPGHAPRIADAFKLHRGEIAHAVFQ